jgi:ketosteroid isomerase-like protein
VTDDEKRALVARWWAIYRDGDVDVLDELCTEPYTRHTSMGTERVSLADYRKRLLAAMEVVRGAVTTVDDQVVDGDRVWSRATSRGVNRTTDEPLVISWLAVHRIEGDRLAESWTTAVPGVDWAR